MQYKEYFAIEKKMKQQGWHGERAELIEQFTSGRKNSLKQLSKREYDAFILSLSTFGKQNQKQNTDWQNSPENTMRRKIWNLFVKQMNYEPNRFQQWVVKYGKFHKPLQEHTHNELVQLLSQAELVYKSYINEINKK